MDLQIIGFFFLGFLFLVFLILLIKGFRKTGQKYTRNAGERMVVNSLLSLPKEYKIYNNLLLQSSRNGTTEIDHVVVSPYGVFVIETKDYYGEVTGRRTEKQWVQNTGMEYKKFGNPLDQNYGHMKTIQEITHVKFDNMVSIVVFTGEANIPNINASLEKEYVIKLDDLLPVIYSYKRKVFKPWFKDKIMERLEENNEQGIIAGAKHRFHVNMTHRNGGS